MSSLQSICSENVALKEELLKWQAEQQKAAADRMQKMMQEWQASALKANEKIDTLIVTKFEELEAKIQAAIEAKHSEKPSTDITPMKGPPMTAIPKKTTSPGPQVSSLLQSPKALPDLQPRQIVQAQEQKQEEDAQLLQQQRQQCKSKGRSSKKVIPMSSDSAGDSTHSAGALVAMPEVRKGKQGIRSTRSTLVHRMGSATALRSADPSKKKTESRRVSISEDDIELGWFLLLPMSKTRLSWDLLILILILYYVVAVPINLAFPYTTPPNAIEYTLNAFFLLDIILNFFTAVYTSEGTLIVDHKSIALDYLSFWFWIDFVASFPLEAVSSSSHSLGGVKIAKVFRILRIFKLLRLLKMQKIVHQIRELTTVNPSTILILQTLIAILVTWHWTACVYWMIAQTEGKDGYTRWQRATDYEKLQKEAICTEEEMEWCSDTDEEGTPWFRSEAERMHFEYSYAMFWAISVTTGTGWDIAPGTPVEVAFTTLMIIVGTLLNVLIIGGVTSIVSNIGHSKRAKRDQLDKISTFLRRRMVPKHLHGKIREYFSFLWSYDIDNVSETDDDVLSVLPKSLRKEVALSVNGELVNRVPLFVGMSADATFDMITYLRRRIFLPKDLVYKQGDEAQEFFMLLRGIVWIYVKDTVGSDGDLNDGATASKDGRGGSNNANPIGNSSSLGGNSRAKHGRGRSRSPAKGRSSSPANGSADNRASSTMDLKQHVHVGTREGEGTFFGETALSKISALEQRQQRKMSGMGMAGTADESKSGSKKRNGSNGNNVHHFSENSTGGGGGGGGAPRGMAGMAGMAGKQNGNRLTNSSPHLGRRTARFSPAVNGRAIMNHVEAGTSSSEGGGASTDSDTPVGWDTLVHRLPQIPQRKTTARAQQYCDVLVLTRADFVQVMVDYPACASQMHHLIEQEVNVTLKTAVSEVRFASSNCSPPAIMQCHYATVSSYCSPPAIMQCHYASAHLIFVFSLPSPGAEIPSVHEAWAQGRGGS
jgi:hypothetical protein